MCILNCAERLPKSTVSPVSTCETLTLKDHKDEFRLSSISHEICTTFALNTSSLSANSILLSDLLPRTFAFDPLHAILYYLPRDRPYFISPGRHGPYSTCLFSVTSCSTYWQSLFQLFGQRLTHPRVQFRLKKNNPQQPRPKITTFAITLHPFSIRQLWITLFSLNSKPI